MEVFDNVKHKVGFNDERVYVSLIIDVIGGDAKGQEVSLCYIRYRLVDSPQIISIHSFLPAQLETVPYEINSACLVK